MRNEQTIEINFNQKLKIGSQLTLNLQNKIKKKVSVKVTKILSSNKIVVKLIGNKNIEPNSKIEIIFTKTNGYYKIKGKFVETKKDNKYVIVTSKIGTKIQERNFFRINIYEKTTFSMLSQSFSKGKKFAGVIEDISAGGLKLITKKRILKGNQIAIDLNFDEFTFNKLIGKIVRVKELSEINNQRYYEAGVEFLCEDKKRNEISQYIFKKQIEFKKVGIF